jgi:hypothetical protein
MTSRGSIAHALAFLEVWYGNLYQDECLVYGKNSPRLQAILAASAEAIAIVMLMKPGEKLDAANRTYQIARTDVDYIVTVDMERHHEVARERLANG